MQFDIFRRHDGALLASPSRFDGALVGHPRSVRFVRRAWVDLHVLSDTFVTELGLHGVAVAEGADAALLRNAVAARVVLGGVE